MLILHDTVSIVLCLDSSKAHHKSEEFVAEIKEMIPSFTKEWKNYLAICAHTHTNERRKETNIKMQEKKSAATENVAGLLLSLDLNTHLTVNCNDYSLPGCCSNLKRGMYLRPKKKVLTCVVKKLKMKVLLLCKFSSHCALLQM